MAQTCAASSTAQAGIGATITASGLEVPVLSVFPPEIMMSSGLVLVRIGETSTGSVLLRLSAMAPAPTSKGAEKGGDPGPSVAAAASPSAQNGPQGSGTLSGDFAVAVSMPSTSGSGAGSSGPGSLNVTVEFN